MKPILYIISGCNGAGKTTASYNVLPEILQCDEFVNADEIAKGLSPFKPEDMAITAGRLMLERIDELLGNKTTFAIETTLATRSYINLIRRAQSIGYDVNLLFFWIESPEMACERVARRVSEGGHNIPAATIERRYWLGLKNLVNIFMPIVNFWSIFDNNTETTLVANSIDIHDLQKFETITNLCRNRKD